MQLILGSLLQKFDGFSNYFENLTVLTVFDVIIGFYGLDNLCAMIDVNRLGQSDPAPLQHDMEQYRKRMESFGFHAIVVDGHDIAEIIKGKFLK